MQGRDSDNVRVAQGSAHNPHVSSADDYACEAIAADLMPMLFSDFPACDAFIAGQMSLLGHKILSDEALFRWGVSPDQFAVLRSVSESVISIWRTTRQAMVLNLEDCQCAGSHWTPSRRTFLFHAHIDARGMLTFAAASAPHWRVTARHRRLLHEMMPKLAALLLRYFRQQTAQSNVKLTPREAQILALIGAGISNKGIAKHLGTSPNTVRNQVARLSEKLRARNRAELLLHSRPPQPIHSTSVP